MEFVHAPYYALFIVGPAANLVEIALSRKPGGWEKQSSPEPGGRGAGHLHTPVGAEPQS